ncbi:Peptidase M20 [Trinorchestia longiramus]|nr:Peptidase M20 [Trinorchestia longiramus]
MSSHSKYSMAPGEDSNSYDSIEKNKSYCQKHYIACTILVVLLLFLVVLGGLLLVAFIRALLLKVPSYVDETTMEQIRQLPNLSSSTFKNLPALLGMALTFPTIANHSGYYEHEPFRGFREFLEKSFPNVFTSTIVEVDERFPSFLLTVQGSGANTSLNSFLLLAHMDVVPVDASAWHDDPFSGKWVDRENGGYVYGRGAIDDKLSVVAILCALDELLGTGWSPNSTFYVAFGHDEEVSGNFGAGEIAKILESKGVHDLFFILDEGMPVMQGFMDGFDVPAALIGVSEKGLLDLRVEATGVAGHSSMPPHHQAIHSLATAIHNLHSSPHPVFQGGPEQEMLLALAPKSSWPLRLALSNPWLFSPLISSVMAGKRETDAVQRTTTATTIIQSGNKVRVSLLSYASCSAAINENYVCNCYCSYPYLQ